MAYRNLDARRSGSGFVWPWTDPGVTKPATPRYHARQGPRNESWQERLYQRQHRSSPPGQWSYVAPSPSNSCSSSHSTARQNGEARPGTGSWNQHRSVARGAGRQETPTPATGNATMPVEEALKRLYRDLSACKILCAEYQRTFDEHAGQLRSRVKSGTLDKVWCDMVAHHDLESFKDATNRARSRTRDLKAVLGTGQPNSPDDDKNNGVERHAEGLERRLRTATKALLDCDQLMGLFDRARMERKACNLLVEELEQVTGALDPSRHPNLYHDGEEDKADGKWRAPAQGRQDINGQGIQKGKAAAQREGNGASGSFAPENGTTEGADQQGTIDYDFSQEHAPDPQQQGDDGRWQDEGT